MIYKARSQASPDDPHTCHFSLLKESDGLNPKKAWAVRESHLPLALSLPHYFMAEQNFKYRTKVANGQLSSLEIFLGFFWFQVALQVIPTL